ncbi:MAG: HAMP domain-containing histidine kinase [Acidobacteria bacterium]|nr:HAMP domain-containing histidine kinase [Acidobacteriota bacterium]
MPSSRSIVTFLVLWALTIAAYASMSLVYSHGSQQLSTFGNIAQCIVPLVANAFLLLNAGTPRWRRNIFWMLLALSCTLWMLGEFDWTYWEVYRHESVPTMYGGDNVFFLRGIPMMAALALQPHRRQAELQLRLGYLDFVSLLTWWTFLYVFVVFPWMYALPSEGQYNFNYDLISNIQNMVIVAGLAYLWLRSKGAWRLVYANLFGAAALYMLSSLTINVAITLHRYSTGSPYDLPLVSSFLWLAFAGLVAYRNRADLEPAEDDEPAGDARSREGNWASRLAMAAAISLPLFAIYAAHYSNEPHEVRDYRTLTAVISSIPLMAIIFYRTYIADKDRARLLSRSEQSVENLQRLQAQLVQTEKLVSLGQLAAGAAHEINNPLAAILGYSDLLADDPSLTEKARGTAAKIRDQARRTKTLVGNLLSFARQVPPERTLLDINTVVTNAIQLRSLDRSLKTRVELQLESVLPGVRGDGNQLMQVFFNIINNAVDAMESHQGGVLTVNTVRDRGNVIVLFSDTGPGLKEPHRVFDPFYTTKPVGKGTGLGLSICFGIVQEHAGKILCYNSQTGGAVFRVELPAVLAGLPAREPQLAVATHSPAPPKR